MTILTRYGFCVLGMAVLVVTLNAQSDFEAKLVGKWKLDTARSQYEGLPRPTDAKLVISAASPSHLKLQTTSRYVKGGQATWVHNVDLVPIALVQTIALSRYAESEQAPETLLAVGIDIGMLTKTQY